MVSFSNSQVRLIQEFRYLRHVDAEPFYSDKPCLERSVLLDILNSGVPEYLRCMTLTVAVHTNTYLINKGRCFARSVEADNYNLEFEPLTT